MKLYEGILFVLIGIITLSVHVNSICQHFGKKCPEETPCCNDGWCSNDPRSCLTGCDPLNSYAQNSCYPKPPCINFFEDFSSPKIAEAGNFSGNPYDADWTSDFSPDYSSTDGNNLILSMKLNTTTKNSYGNYQGFGTTVSSTRWMLYGTVSARIKAASTSLGVVTSLVISNNTLDTLGDEIDYEWVGLNRNQVQSNYYWNGNLDYTKGMKHQLGFDVTQDYHTYTVDWQPEYLKWYVDGNLMRTLTKNSTYDATEDVYKYPSAQSRIAFSVWDGGMGAQGTAQWAGTPTDWSNPNKVYSMSVDWVNITCANPASGTDPWPPAGYGPTNSSSTNGTSSSGNDPSGGGGTDGSTSGSGNSNSTEIEANSSVPDYSGSQLKKLAIPIGVVLGLVLGGALLIGVWKYAFRRRSGPVTPNGKWGPS